MFGKADCRDLILTKESLGVLLHFCPGRASMVTMRNLMLNCFSVKGFVKSGFKYLHGEEGVTRNRAARPFQRTPGSMKI